jgi:hypothetical protein
VVSGFWHGASWNFMIWGFLNGLYFLPLILAERNRNNDGIVAEGRHLPSLREAGGMVSTFILACMAWVFFRARNVEQAVDYLAGMASPSLLHPPHIGNNNLYLLLPIFVGIEWWGRHGEHALERVALGWGRGLRWTFYGVLIGCIGLFMRTDEAPFIYFQF